LRPSVLDQAVERTASRHGPIVRRIAFSHRAAAAAIVLERVVELRDAAGELGRVIAAIGRALSAAEGAERLLATPFVSRGIGVEVRSTSTAAIRDRIGSAGRRATIDRGTGVRESHDEEQGLGGAQSDGRRRTWTERQAPSEPKRHRRDQQSERDGGERILVDAA